MSRTWPLAFFTNGSLSLDYVYSYKSSRRMLGVGGIMYGPVPDIVRSCKGVSCFGRWE